MIRRTSHFAGRVQGVGFRYTAVDVAKHHPRVVGYVRNLADGRVELVAEGAAADIDGLLADLAARMEHFIEQRTDLESPPTGEFEGFSVRH